MVTRAYDANYRLTDLTSPAFSLHVARDAMGDITAIGNAPGANPATETYSYDPLYRLTAVTEAGGSPFQSVTYNPTGDRTSKSGAGLATGTYTYNANTHQLATVGTNTFTEDVAGNITGVAEAGATYAGGYNNRNRLAWVQLNGSTVATYTYNALGQRFAKTSGGTTVYFDYNAQGQMLGEYGTSTRDYVWMDGIPVANVDTTGATSTITYVTADQLGTPRAIADSSGTTVWQWAYQSNAWGEAAPISTGYVYNLRFPGQYADAETGLSYNVNRDYDSDTGRYMQSDPLGLRGGQSSTYVYVGSDPLNSSDPLGLVKWTGTFHQGALVIGAGAILGFFDLTSECVNKQKAEIEVTLLNGAAGVGPKWSIGADDRGEVSFHDASETINPDLANGPAGVLGGGATVGKVSIGYTKIRLGHLYSDSVSSRGLDIGASVGVGSSWVTKTTWKKCGCGS